MGAPFISRDDLSNRLGTDVTADENALMAVDAACEIVRSLADQTFDQATDTVTLDGTGTDALLLPELPVTNAGTVTVNGTAVTDYVLNGNGILYRRGTLTGSPDYDTPTTPKVWPSGRQNVSVTYDHGYAPDDLPRDVRAVALNVASRLFVQQVSQLSETVGETQIRYAVAPADLTVGEQAIVRKHRPSR